MRTYPDAAADVEQQLAACIKKSGRTITVREDLLLALIRESANLRIAGLVSPPTNDTAKYASVEFSPISEDWTGGNSERTRLIDLGRESKPPVWHKLIKRPEISSVKMPIDLAVVQNADNNTALWKTLITSIPQ